jgi:hypothetical protein
MITRRNSLVALLLVAAGIGCGDKTTAPPPVPPAPPPPPPPPPPPLPGSAVVSLTTPNGDDGAIIVTLQGPDLSALQSSNAAYIFFTRLPSSSEARVTLVGNVAAGSLFTFKLGAGQALSAYTARVQQVATRGDSLRTSTNGYQLTVSAAP